MPVADSSVVWLIASFISPPSQSIPRTERVPPTPALSLVATASAPPSSLTRESSTSPAVDTARVPFFIIVPTESKSFLFHTPLGDVETWRIVWVAFSAPSIIAVIFASFESEPQSSINTPLKDASDVFVKTRVVLPSTLSPKLFLTVPVPSIPFTKITPDL